MDAIDFLTNAQAAFAKEDYAQTLSLIADAEVLGKVCPDLLILKAACIQLAVETDFPVERALSVYCEILQKQPSNTRALLEKGYFLLNVSDDPKRASGYFEKAIAMLGEQIGMALVGLGKCSLEAGNPIEKVVEETEIQMSEIVRAVHARLRR